jgi:D-beta-D-heptose 7-phosphate kinase/D-beta-D-heptose 1-phosphate adenosyltransferase
MKEFGIVYHGENIVKSEDIVLITGGFDPVHSGHIEYIKAASEIGRVVIGLNSDDWLVRKKKQAFMPISERKSVLENLKQVMCVIEFNDADGTACDAIRIVKEMFPNQKVLFANGGDRGNENTPEIDRYKNDPRVEFIFGVGGDYKKNSSSWILAEWKHPSESRQWGKFMTYYETLGCKVKRLELEPGKSISMQYHLKRSELWFVEDGIGTVYGLTPDRVELELTTLKTNSHWLINRATWHRLENTGNTPLKIIEIQFGLDCTEEDIVRLA